MKDLITPFKSSYADVVKNNSSQKGSRIAENRNENLFKRETGTSRNNQVGDLAQRTPTNRYHK